MKKFPLILSIISIYFFIAIVTEIRFANEVQNNLTYDFNGWFRSDIYFVDTGEEITLLRWDRIFILVVSFTFISYKLNIFSKQKKESNIKPSRMKNVKISLIASLMLIYLFACFVADTAVVFDHLGWDGMAHTQNRHLFYHEHVYYVDYTNSIETSIVYKWDRIFVAVVSFALPIYYLLKRPFRYFVESHKSKKMETRNN